MFCCDGRSAAEGLGSRPPLEGIIGGRLLLFHNANHPDAFSTFFSYATCMTFEQSLWQKRLCRTPVFFYELLDQYKMWAGFFGQKRALASSYVRLSIVLRQVNIVWMIKSDTFLKNISLPANAVKSNMTFPWLCYLPCVKIYSERGLWVCTLRESPRPSSWLLSQ
jgi:hypothetical protein